MGTNSWKNNNRFLLLIIFFSFALLAFLIIHYFSNSNSSNIPNTDNFSNYLSGVFTPLIALSGVIVTLLLGIISDKRNQTNIKIEQQKQRPLLHISYTDREKKVEIYMMNKGNGPLIISNYRLVNNKSGKVVSGIYDCLPSIERNFDFYSGNQNNTVLSINEKTDLFLLEYAEGEDLKVYEESRDLIREEISDYKILVDYKDVYDNIMPAYERSLKWFARHHEEENIN